MSLLRYLLNWVCGRSYAALSEGRSPKWAKAREEYLKRFPTCAACGGRAALNVHHKKPFHIFPELELVEDNFITLCEQGPAAINCHYTFGHSSVSWSGYNPEVERDAQRFRDMRLACKFTRE